MLGAEIRAKYFAEMSGRYVRYQKWGTWFTLLFASSNAVALLATIPQQLTWVRLTLAVCVTGTSIYLAIAGNIQKAFDCSNLHEAWSKLYQGYRTIWEDTDSVNALALLSDLDARAIGISRSSTSLPYDQKGHGKMADSYGARTRACAGCPMLKRASPEKAADIWPPLERPLPPPPKPPKPPPPKLESNK
jgi:hypothetical protein